MSLGLKALCLCLGLHLLWLGVGLLTPCFQVFCMSLCRKGMSEVCLQRAGGMSLSITYASLDNIISLQNHLPGSSVPGLSAAQLPGPVLALHWLQNACVAGLVCRLLSRSRRGPVNLLTGQEFEQKEGRLWNPGLIQPHCWFFAPLE